MKSTDNFAQTIAAYLEELAKEDVMFRDKYCNPKKNIKDCCTYILNFVQRSGCNGFSDDEIFSQAVHYYEEENIEVGKSMDAHIVVNHTIELTEEEKQKAKADAIRQYQAEELTKMQNRKRSKPVAPKVDNQPSLFNF